jgi:hypothetical protein
MLSDCQVERERMAEAINANGGIALGIVEVEGKD